MRLQRVDTTGRRSLLHPYMLPLLLSSFSHVQLCVNPLTAAHRPPRPWDSPGKNTGAGCHFLLQSMKVKSESEVAQSCPTLSDPMDRSLPGSSIHGIFQARALEGGATAFSHPYMTSGKTTALTRWTFVGKCESWTLKKTEHQRIDAFEL